MPSPSLTRWFSSLSLILLAVGTLLIGSLVRKHEMQQIHLQAEEYNVVLTGIAGHLIRPWLLDATAARPAANTDLADRIDQQLAQFMRHPAIAKIKLYDLAGNTRYSTDRRQIGENKPLNPAYLAARNGRIVSEFTHRDQFSASEGERRDVDLVSSYIPLLENGQPIAVFELYQDVTPLVNRLEASLWHVWAIVSGVLSLLFLAQVQLLARAQRQIRQQESQLEARNRELESGFVERSRQLERLRHEQQLIFDNAQVGILLLQQRRILKCNQRIADMFGYASPAELEGHSTELLYASHEDFTAAGQNGYSRLATLGHADFEMAMRRHDGGQIWIIQSGRPLDPAEVLDAPSIWTYTDITERKQAEEQIRNLAFFDQLTGLPNRTLLLDRLKQAIHTCQRDGTHGAVVFIDLDHFKRLNDTLGHEYGDLLLQQVGRALTDNIRQCDTVARLGGDEFILILVGLEPCLIEAATHVEAITSKLLAILHRTFTLNDAEFHGSASMGATLFNGQNDTTDELLKQADLAMYRSKEAGRNAFTFFDPSMEESVLARTQLDNELRQAVEHDQFILHYQPLVDGIRNTVVGAEALLRWQHPNRGLVPPGEFIPAAESSGLIIPLGLWVLTRACGQLAVWAKNPETAALTLSINVSVQQFRQADFAEQVLAIIESSGAEPTRLKLELTESLFVENVEDIIDKMTRLRSAGVSFSLDDFGTGYSSLANLSRLPLAQLKIDRSFVCDLASNDHNLAICIATISLAHTLKLKVVAEGVEDEAQRYILTTAHHCDLLQGYLFGRPMPLEEFERRLASPGKPIGENKKPVEPCWTGS